MDAKDVRSALETMVTEAAAAMPSRLHASGRLEVEVNRCFADFIRSQAKASARDLENWGKMLSDIMQDHNIAEPRPTPPASPQKAAPKRDPALCLRELGLLVGAAFTGTFDGSLGVVKAAQARAWQDVHALLDHWDLPLADRKRLEEEIARDIADCFASVIFSSDGTPP